MRSNPFTSSTYESVWSKYFNDGRALESFEFIRGVKFLKNKSDGVYINAARNLTKGIYYELDHTKSDYKGKVFLLYDVPEYFKVAPFDPPSESSLRLKKVYQYQGFLMNISSFEDVDAFINTQFSSKNRREFRSNRRRLETCFNIRYEFIHDAIPQDKFDKLFQQFYTLLSERFEGKKVDYHHLSKRKWEFYSELVYEMLKEKKSSLLVIYRDDQPIGITLNFHSENVLFETLTVFDPDYYKFSIGKTSIIKLLEWCFANAYDISDFSKGDFAYKHKWSNEIYDFNYHILYDGKSLKSVLKAKYVESYFKLKLYLRRKKINELYRKFKFLIDRESRPKGSPISERELKFEKIDFNDINVEEYQKIDYESSKFDYLLRYIYSFAFANPETIQNITAYQALNNKDQFIIKGTDKAQKITFN